MSSVELRHIKREYTEKALPRNVFLLGQRRRSPIPLHRESIHTPEQKQQPPVRVALVNMEGEGGLSFHEPIGVEAIAGKLFKDIPDIEIGMFDTQPELKRTGRVDTDKLAERIRDFANDGDPKIPVVLGLSVPIYSWAYVESLLIKLDQQTQEEDTPLTIILGNAIPTYTKKELLKKNFPHIKLVVGEGEDAFSEMVQGIARGEEVKDSLEHGTPSLEEYPQLVRLFLPDALSENGVARAEASRGCAFGGCTFCSRCKNLRGKDYRTVNETAVVREVRELVDTFNVTRFELSDEEAFDEREATSRLISAWKSADLPRVPFVASLRVETLIDLNKKLISLAKVAPNEERPPQVSRLQQLQGEVGLEKVFLGVEGGSDDYLKQIGKGQTMKEVYEAIQIAHERNLDMEMGFITFSYRMTKEMLTDNIKFLSREDVFPHVSSLFNLLEVRASTMDEEHLERYVRVANDPAPAEQRNIRLRDDLRKQVSQFAGYDPAEHFNINASRYEDVPFVDEEVGRIYQQVEAFGRADAGLYYALKSNSRAAALPADTQKQVDDFCLKMKKLHRDYLRHAAGLPPLDTTNEVDKNTIEQERLALVSNIKRAFGTELRNDSLDTIRRETSLFLRQEEERKLAQEQETQIGALAVFKDNQGRLLLVRPVGQEAWSFPGGNIHPGENTEQTIRRELKEEIRVDDITFLAKLPTEEIEGHIDHTTGLRAKLELKHRLVQLNQTPTLENSDGEIADILYLSPADITNGRVIVRDNVREVAKYIQSPEPDEPIEIFNVAA